MKFLKLLRVEDGSFSCPVPASARNHWCVLVLRPAGQRRDMPARVRLRMENDPFTSAETFIPAPHGISGIAGRVTVMHIPPTTDALHADLFGIAPSVQSAGLFIQPVSRTFAAGLLAMRDPRRMLAALRGSRHGLGRRIRTALALPAGAETGRRSYPLWLELFDSWGKASPASAIPNPAPPVGVVILQPAPAEACLKATLASIGQQAERPMVVTGTGDPARQALIQAISKQETAYIAILQAGEMLRPDALAVIRGEAAGQDAPDAIFADEDRLNKAGRRHSPLFKPAANHSLMLSGTLTQGIWAFRRDDLLALLSRTKAEGGELWAEALRLELWLLLYERATAPRSRHLPYLLSHRREDTAAAPAGILAAVVREHIARTALPATIERETFPLQVRFRLPPALQKMVSILVPTAARSSHVTDCLSAVLAKTDYTNFEIVIVVSQNHPLEDRQKQVLAPILADPRTKLVHLQTEAFNYSSANNEAARQASGELLCLLNDDVAPMQADWLAGMTGHLADPRIGAVGAKLYYPNRTIQHGGVIIGLAGLAEHANRMLTEGEPGYASRAILNQEVSAVTGACLLVRRSVHEALGGLDETYPIAFNDVDYCLRIREAGHGIVFSAQTEMWHYESVSLGHHFSGARAALEAVEVLRMRTRWTDICRNDPFHNPNLSQKRGAEWELAFPPRVDPPAGFA